MAGTVISGLLACVSNQKLMVCLTGNILVVSCSAIKSWSIRNGTIIKLSRTHKVQVENVFDLARVIRRTACADVETTGPTLGASAVGAYSACLAASALEAM